MAVPGLQKAPPSLQAKQSEKLPSIAQDVFQVKAPNPCHLTKRGAIRVVTRGEDRGISVSDVKGV